MGNALLGATALLGRLRPRKRDDEPTTVLGVIRPVLRRVEAPPRANETITS
jgi:hypothetical protein